MATWAITLMIEQLKLVLEEGNYRNGTYPKP